jgi:hypothetical protein
VGSHFQFELGGVLSRYLRAAGCLAAVLALVVFLGQARAAQNAPATVIAHIDGADVSIDGNMLTKASTLVSVVNGNVVTVHSGQASMRLVDGGEISICGPAKFTVLQSNGEITLALEFGRLHAELPSTITLRVLTPSIVATPIEISGGKRDLTVGLDQDDSLCVLASIGAVQLEQQFSGERLIVPESGDFSLQSGQLVPVADTGQACKCEAVPQIVPAPAAPAPETAMQSPPAIPQSAIDQAAAQRTPSPSPAQQLTQLPSVEVALLARPNEDHPIAPDQDPQAAAAPPAESAPVEKIVLPSMVYAAGSPAPPDVPTEETALLIREVHVDSDWEFTGRVESPGFAQAMSQALGEGGPSRQPQAAGAVAAASPKKSGGFWAGLKRAFTGTPKN